MHRVDHAPYTTRQAGKHESECVGVTRRANVERAAEGSTGSNLRTMNCTIVELPICPRCSMQQPAHLLHTSSAPRSDPKKLEKLETKSEGRSALSQGLIFLKVALCRQGIFIFVSRSESVWVFSRCLQVSSYFLKVDRQTRGARFPKYRLKACFYILRNLKV